MNNLYFAFLKINYNLYCISHKANLFFYSKYFSSKLNFNFFYLLLVYLDQDIGLFIIFNLIGYSILYY